MNILYRQLKGITAMAEQTQELSKEVKLQNTL
jgi:hypothetical protein